MDKATKQAKVQKICVTLCSKLGGEKRKVKCLTSGGFADAKAVENGLSQEVSSAHSSDEGSVMEVERRSGRFEASNQMRV